NDVGEYYVGVIGDAENNLPSDNNKENNKLITSAKLTVLDPMGGCFEDAFEPNNFLEQSLGVGEGFIGSLGMCASEDWFSVNILQGESLIVTMNVTSPLYLEPRPYDIDIDLVSPPNKIVDKSDSTGSIERVAVYAVGSDATFYLRVKPKQTGWEGHYSLDVNVVSPLEGIDLMPHHITALPAKIYPGGLISVSGEAVNLGGTDAPAFDTALFFSDDEVFDETDMMLDLFTVEGVFAASKGDFSRNVILPSDVPGGVYYVIAVVDQLAVVAEEDETNNTAVSGKIELDESIACVDDGFEPNNSVEIATPLKGDSAYIQELMVCPQLDDWYEIDLPEGVNFGASVNYTQDPSKGYVYLQLYDENKTAVVDSSSAASMSSVGIPYVFHGGKYYLRVYNAPQGGKTAPYEYSLGMNVSAPFPSDICEGDKHEPNHDYNAASFIGCGENRMTLCKKDKDFFKVSLLSGDALVLTLKHPKDHLKLSLYEDPLKSPVKSTAGSGTIEYIASKDIIIYFGVELKNSTITLSEYDYSLTVDGIPGIDLTCSGLSIFPVEVYQGEDLSLEYSVNNMCKDDAPAFFHSIYLSDDALPDAGDIELLNIESEGGIKGKEVLKFSNKVMVPLATEPGEYNLLIYADPEEIISESQEDNNFTGGQFSVIKVCLNDMFEPNDTFAQAAVISGGVYATTMICPYDLDFYSLYIEGGATAAIKILFVHKDGDLDLRFYGESGEVPLAVSLSKDDDEEIVHTVSESGYYFIRVNGFLGNQNDYKLVVEIQ
ncbi:MAG: hypothetical protein FJ088_02955, partial [Deltaproteobacteria bacterium]|nr:hypothetical protein [Deltaproteobacteria bacterium]